MAQIYSSYSGNKKIVADTEALADYSRRVAKLAGDLSDLEKRLDALYVKTKLVELDNICKQKAVSVHIPAINNISKSLKLTAEELEDTENAIRRLF